MSAPQPRDGELLILSKLEHLEKDVQALAPLLEKIIAHLAAQKTPEKPKLASYDQLYPTLQPPAPVEDGRGRREGPELWWLGAAVSEQEEGLMPKCSLPQLLVILGGFHVLSGAASALLSAGPTTPQETVQRGRMLLLRAVLSWLDGQL